MERERAKSAAIAKWGAACAPCATAKAKCLRSNDTPGSKCDRCERLQKDCAGQVHRPRKKRQTRPSKTAQLEERLNSLVDLLRASNSGQAVSRLASDEAFSYGTPFEAGPGSLRRPSAPVSSQSSPTTTTSGHERSGIVPLEYNDHAPPRCICRAPAALSFEPVEADEVLLSTFMTKLSPNYPFVTLRPGTSLAELRATKPFLFSVIRMVSSVHHTASMRAQYYVIIKHISEQALLRSERSLELLQGILLVLGWYHHHCMMHTQMNNLASLALSLSWDLGICQPPGLLEKTRLLVLNPEQPPERTHEERRALCGTWYINSAIALAYGKVERPKYNRYIAQCVQELQSAKEFESDLVLVQLMKIQRLTDRIHQLLDSDNGEEEVSSIPRAPTMAYVSAFQADLDRFQAQIPRQLRSNRLIMFHVRSAAMRMWEPPKMDASLLENLSKSFTALSTGGPSTLDFLYNSHNALKEWFEFLLSIEPGEFVHLSMPPCAQLIVAVTFLARWARLSCTNIPRTYTNSERIFDPTSANGGGARLVADLTLRDADPAVPAAAKTLGSLIHSQPGLHLDVAGLLRRLIQRFQQVRSVVGGKEGPEFDYNIWDIAAHKMGILRLKLERWTEIVSTLGSEGLLARKSHAAGDSEGSSSAEESSDPAEVPPTSRAGPMEGIEIVDAAAMPPNPEAWQYNNDVFANDLFDGLGLDQNFFYDGGDYGASLLSSLQPIMQEQHLRF